MSGSEITDEKQTDKPWLFKPGQSGNPGGRPKGSGYKQKWNKMLECVAKERGITVEQAEMELFKVAYEQAEKGNFQYFKDTMDRIYGVTKSEATTIENVEKLVIIKDYHGSQTE